MGVYVFRCRHAEYVKVGHHLCCRSRPNAYYRVAGRGFQGCVHPDELDGKLYVDDLELVGWFPDLTMQHEREIHRRFAHGSVGEFHRSDQCDAILAECCRLGGTATVVSSRSRARAIRWGYRQIRKAKRRRRRLK